MITSASFEKKEISYEEEEEEEEEEKTITSSPVSWW